MKAKRVFRRLVAAGFQAGGAPLVALMQRLIQGWPILTYHRILPEDMAGRCYSHPSIITGLEAFTSQMATLKKRRTPVSLDQLLSGLYGGEDLPRDAVAVTFDDGWADNYEYAFPVLQRFSIPATVYLTAGRIGSQRPFWQERFRHAARTADHQALAAAAAGVPDCPSLLQQPAAYKNPDALIQQCKNHHTGLMDECADSLDSVLQEPFPLHDHAFLTWDNVREMSTLVDFGSHTMEHRILTLDPPSVQVTELAASKERIEQELGRACRHFAYPNGNYSADLEKLVLQSGYASAAATRPGLNRPETPRTRLARIDAGGRRFQVGENVHEGLFQARLTGVMP